MGEDAIEHRHVSTQALGVGLLAGVDITVYLLDVLGAFGRSDDGDEETHQSIMVVNGNPSEQNVHRGPPDALCPHS